MYLVTHLLVEYQGYFIFISLGSFSLSGELVQWSPHSKILSSLSYILILRLNNSTLSCNLLYSMSSLHCLAQREFGTSHSWYFAYNQHHFESVFSFIEKFLLNWEFGNINLTHWSRYCRIHKILLLSGYKKTKWLIQLMWEGRVETSLLHICLWFKHYQFSKSQLQPLSDSVVDILGFFSCLTTIYLFSFMTW